MGTSTEIREIAEQDVAVVEFAAQVAHLGSLIGEAFETVMAYLGSQGVFPAGPPFTYYLPQSGEGQLPSQLQVWAGFPVPRPISGDDRVVARKLPAGKVATLVHEGPYEALPTSYQTLIEGAAALGAPVDMHAGMWEVYLNDPDEVSPNQSQAAIFWPVVDG